MSIKVLIADDHHIIRQGIVRLIEGDDSYTIVGEAGDGQQALQKIKETKPDVAVLDITMPVMTGLEVVRELNKEGIDVEIIILTMNQDEEYMIEAINLGVKGYVLKENTADDLLTALKFVSKGDQYISPLMSKHLVKRIGEKRSFKSENPTVDLLSPAERRILKLIAVNKTSKEIAGELFISYRTVQNHRTNICTKLGIKGMNGLLKFAIENKSKF